MKCPYCEEREATVKLNRRHSQSMACEECTKEQPPHECPYRSEINDDFEDCTCSIADEHECNMDI